MTALPTVQTEDRYSPASIRELFDEMAGTYGIVNLISSFGFAAFWRHQVTQDLRLAEDSHVVDLMSGMNELCRFLSAHVPRALRVTAVDISPEMVRRARNDWPFRVTTCLEDALTWDLSQESADAVISSFGLKRSININSCSSRAASRTCFVRVAYFHSLRFLSRPDDCFAWCTCSI